MSKSWVYTDLSVKDSLILEVSGVAYAVTQHNSTWACNEVPTGMCLIAPGRRVNSAGARELARVHAGISLRQMVPAKVWFQPKEEYGVRPGSRWPGTRQVIFDGFLTGLSMRKVNGKFHVIANLLHWLAALGFSSCLGETSHVSNPSNLSTAAVLRILNPTGVGQGNYIGGLSAAQLVGSDVAADLAVSIKKIFCALANVPTLPVSANGECNGQGDARVNTTALGALRRIEGADGLGCDLARKWSVPLRMNIPPALTGKVEDAIAAALGKELIESYATTSFWDKLVGQFCPDFGMALVPMVDRAILIADTPALADPAATTATPNCWKVIKTWEADSVDSSAELPRPLQAVIVLANWESQTLRNDDRSGSNTGNNFIGGCYAQDSILPGDGMRLYVPPPSWAVWSRAMLSSYTGMSTGIMKEAASPAVGSSTPAQPPPIDVGGTFGTLANELYDRYAQVVYGNNMLRGRFAAFGGKLRFDIAPASLLRCEPHSDPFTAGEDALAVLSYGCTQRVSITINAEAAMAGSTFMLSHVRQLAEVNQPRTSFKEHPLFGKAIHGGGKHGCPLVDAFNDLD